MKIYTYRDAVPLLDSLGYKIVHNTFNNGPDFIYIHPTLKCYGYSMYFHAEDMDEKLYTEAELLLKLMEN